MKPFFHLSKKNNIFQFEIMQCEFYLFSRNATSASISCYSDLKIIILYPQRKNKIKKFSLSLFIVKLYY